MRKFGFTAAFLFLVMGCAASRHTSAAREITPQPYMRVSTVDSNIVELQIAVRKFVPAHRSGPVVWLVGASHLGEPAYYQSLQRLLDAQTLVLFEGVGPHPEPRDLETNSTRPRISHRIPNSHEDDSLGSLQQTAAQSLGLVFQLDAIDYDRPNFRNSDLSVGEIQSLLSQPSTDGPAAQQEFYSLVELMQGGNFLSTVINTALRYIGADPKLRASARLVLIEILGGLCGDLSQIQGLPPDLRRLLQTLIQSRNQKVMADLDHVLKQMQPHGSVAVFYGTGHMDNLEKRLRMDLRYRPAGEQWFTAFSVNLARSGISPSEAGMIRWFAHQQMQQLQLPSGNP